MARDNTRVRDEDPTEGQEAIPDPQPESNVVQFDGEHLEEPPIGEKPKPIRRTTSGAWVVYLPAEDPSVSISLTLHADEMPALREVALAGGAKALQFVPWGSSLEAELEASRKD